MAQTQSQPKLHNRPHVEPLRWIGAYKLLKAVLSLLAGLMVLQLMHRDLPAVALEWLEKLHIRPESHLGQAMFREVLVLNAKALGWVAAGLFAYVPLAVLEGAGLILRKVWAEWITVVTTSALIPIEIHHLIKHPRYLGAVILGLNILVAIYLAWRIRRDRGRHGRAPSPG